MNSPRRYLFGSLNQRWFVPVGRLAGDEDLTILGHDIKFETTNMYVNRRRTTHSKSGKTKHLTRPRPREWVEGTFPNQAISAIFCPLTLLHS